MRSFKNIVNIYPKIINNKVDKDVQEMLYPLDFMQCLIFISKYHIRNNLIAPIGVITTFISMIATMAFVFVHIYQTLFATSETNSIASVTTENITRYFSCVFYCSVFTINFIMCVIQTNKSIKFVLTYQKVHRFLKNSGSYSYNNNYIIWNWVFVVTAVTWHTSTIVYCIVSIGYNFFVTTCYMYPIMLFDINMVYAMRIIKLLENEINIWNDVIKSDRLHTQDENYCRNLFNIYVEILECYEIFKDCFQQSILFSIIEQFIHPLVYIQRAIDVIKMGIVFKKIVFECTICTSVWLIKYMVWQTLLHQHCEMFYIAMENVQDGCLLLLKSRCSEYEKILCKNVMRLHHATFNKINVCGLFYVDASLQLSLMGLLTNYTIVLLQFAFL